MVTQAFERAGRHLRQHHEKLQRAVGTRIAGLTILLFLAWDDERGRIRVLRIRASGWRIDLFTTRAIATAVLGKGWLAGHELSGPFHVDYVIEMDGGALHEPVASLRIRDPSAVRWFDGRKLAKGIGDTHDGWMEFERQSFLPAPEEAAS
jgi:hypothetical protein